MPADATAQRRPCRMDWCPNDVSEPDDTCVDHRRKAATVLPTPLTERLSAAVAAGASVLDETDLANVVAAVLPVVEAVASGEFDRGLVAGDYFARQKVAHRLGLGDIR